MDKPIPVNKRRQKVRVLNNERILIFIKNNFREARQRMILKQWRK